MVHIDLIVRGLFRKRPSARAPELPSELLAVWMPLLDRLDDLYEGFQEVLLARMVELLCASTSEGKLHLTWHSIVTSR